MDITVVNPDGQAATKFGAYTYGSGSPHDYFNMLKAQPEHWRSYSLRDPIQLTQYKQTSSRREWVTYDPSMDAAKVVIPTFDEDWPYATLATAIDATQTTITLAVWHSMFIKWRIIRIDGEAMLISAINSAARTLTVSRGRYGTTATPHATGSSIYVGTNSLLNQIRVPVDAASGAGYLITWDAMWTPSYQGILMSHKAFQLSNPNDSIHLETQTRFTGEYSTGFNAATDVASVTLRSYGATAMDPVTPKVGQFIIKPNRWTRFWIHVPLNTGLDPVSMWVADEATNPVKVYDTRSLDLWAFSKFWLEFNTSTDTFVRGNIRDYVSYVRNVAVLKNVPSVTPFLVKP